MSDIPVVSVFGVEKIDLKSFESPPYEARDLECHCHLTDDNLQQILVQDRPAAVVSFGEEASFKNLMTASFQVRKMWIHFKDTNDLKEKGQKTFMCFLMNAIMDRSEVPLVSVFTPAFNSGDKIQRPYQSLLAQTYKDWEWVILDDSNDDGSTFSMLSDLAKTDSRIRVFKESQRSGRIGAVKKTCCGIAEGKYLVELDHDDELTPKALEYVTGAFKKFGDAGFVYTDFAETFEDGSPMVYGQGWGLGYGTYREEIHGGIKYMVPNGPNVNPKTIRHIVAAPNHIRAWRKTLYDEIGGHRNMLHIVDDYELLIRTFLATRIVRIPKMCYVQYRNSTGNTQGARNKDIQRLVRYISMAYDKQIHERLLALGVDDFVWMEGEASFNRLHIPNPEVEPHCTLIFDPDKEKT